jgi:hypothetical protein
VNGPPKSGPILTGTQLPFADLFCHFKSVTDLMRGILGLVTDLVFGTSKTLAVPYYKYARVPEKRYIQKTHNTPQPACCAPVYATSSRSSAIGRAGLRNLVLSNPALGESKYGFWKALCATAPTLPHHHPLRLLVCGARLGVIKRAEVLIVAVVFFTRLFRSD